MNLALPVVILLAAMTFCGLGSNSGPASNSASTPAVQATATPLDRATVQSQVVSTANDILNASHRGHVDVLEEALTEDFESTDIDGTVQNKREVLAGVKVERAIKEWAITEPELASFDDRSAALRYVLSVTGANGRRIKARVNDTYVRRDGRWMLKSQQISLLK